MDKGKFPLFGLKLFGKFGIFFFFFAFCFFDRSRIFEPPLFTDERIDRSIDRPRFFQTGDKRVSWKQGRGERKQGEGGKKSAL